MKYKFRIIKKSFKHPNIWYIIPLFKVQLEINDDTNTLWFEISFLKGTAYVSIKLVLILKNENKFEIQKIKY